MNNRSTKGAHQPRHDNAFVRKIRLHYGYLPEEFAKKLGMTVSKLGRIERGESYLKPEDKSALSALAGISDTEIEGFEPADAAQKHREAKSSAAAHPDGMAPLPKEEVWNLMKQQIAFSQQEIQLLHDRFSNLEALHRDTLATMRALQESHTLLLSMFQEAFRKKM